MTEEAKTTREKGKKKAHIHNWKLPEDGGVVIDTLPPLSTYYCDCGKATHDPETGEECNIKHYDL